ncbi:hypothetical protein LTR27_011272 [Elasticomyces elasticus]|nr:hypothetical protein LTR27_011272 [Elasticomyces elasticus]
MPHDASIGTTSLPTAWLDKIPAELRVEIFTHSLYRGRRGLKPCAKKNNTDIALLVALVNDPEKYSEACEVFYGCNTFVLDSSRQLKDLTRYQVPTTAMRSITHLELVNIRFPYEFLSIKSVQKAISRVSAYLPKLKSLAFSYDYLKVDPRKYIDGDFIKDRKLTCVAVGCYTLDRKERFAIVLRHYSFVQCWSEMKESEHGTLTSVESQLNYALHKHEHDGIFKMFFETLSLAEWISIFDAHMIETLSKGSGREGTALSDREQNFLAEFRDWLERDLRAESSKIDDAVRGGTSFRDLDVGPHNSKTLEAIGDFLCDIQRWFANLLETDHGRRAWWHKFGCRKLPHGALKASDEDSMGSG